MSEVEKIDNGLADALGVGLGGGINPFGFPGNQGTGFSQPVSSTTPLFRQLRYYLISNFRQIISQCYAEIGLFQAVCNVPVDDALRGGITIKSKQLSEEQIEALQISVDRDNDLTTAGQAAKWNRAYGGAGIIVLTDQDPETPFNIKALTADENLEFRAVDMWELFWDKQSTEGYDPTNQTENFDYYNYYGEQIHKSRVMRLIGVTAPSFIRPRLRGWGLSVFEPLVSSLNQYIKAIDVSYNIIDEAKVDVYKIKNLVNTLLSPNGAQKIYQRMQIANLSKNYNNALVMDSEDDWEQKQLSFAGIAEYMQSARMQIASDVRIPMLKLFGTPATGMNASDEDSIEVYNAMVESEVRNKLKYDILRMLEIKSQLLFGFVPDDLSLEFKPLRVLSGVQEEEVKTQKFNRLIQAKERGEISDMEFRDACNKGNLFDVKLDTKGISDVADTAEEGANDPAKSKDVDNPGANRVDTRKSRATEEGGADTEPPAPKSTDASPAKVTKTKNGNFILNESDFDESKHPRADDGKFGEGGGDEVHHSSYEKFSSKDIKPSKGGYFGEGFYVHKDKKETYQYGDSTHTYKLSKKPVFDLSGDKLKPETLGVFKDMGLDVEKIKTPSKFRSSLNIAISEIREKFPGEETVGIGAMKKLRSVLKEKGYIGIQFSHNDTDENMVIFEKKDLGLKNSLNLQPWKTLNKINRALANSAEFDRASYEADGGDSWVDPRRAEFFSNPGKVDESLWARAKEASVAAFGKDKWQFVTWWYKKQGGKFG